MLSLVDSLKLFATYLDPIYAIRKMDHFKLWVINEVWAGNAV